MTVSDRQTGSADVVTPPAWEVANIASTLRKWEAVLEEDYPGTRWRLRIDPEHAGEITEWGSADGPP